jgi:hypothetical protein
MRQAAVSKNLLILSGLVLIYDHPSILRAFLVEEAKIVKKVIKSQQKK